VNFWSTDSSALGRNNINKILGNWSKKQKYIQTYYAFKIHIGSLPTLIASIL